MSRRPQTIYNKTVVTCIEDEEVLLECWWDVNKEEAVLTEIRLGGTEIANQDNLEKIIGEKQAVEALDKLEDEACREFDPVGG